MTTAEHGTLRRYIVDGCRCTPCRTHRVRWQKQYLYDVSQGRPRTVPIDVVRGHLTMLRDSGMSWWGITKAAGYTSRNAVMRFMDPDAKRVNTATAQRVLAVTPDSDTRPTAPRPSAPTRDRLRALAVMGWDCRALADRLTITHDQVDMWRSGQRAWVMARNETAVAALFDTLWDTPGPSTRTATWAKRQGWPAPLDLDGDTPTGDTPRCGVCEDIDFLRSCGEADAAIAARVGLSRARYIPDHLQRHGETA